MVQYWRAAGVSYLRYSNLCADALRSALKKDAMKKATPKAPFSMTKSTWEAGKPVARGML